MPLPSPPSLQGRLAAVALPLVLAAPWAGPAAAGVQCAAEDGAGWRHCQAFIAEPLAQRMLQAQERSRWCWAAAISMVFARYGYALSQEEIVERMYGVAANVGIPTQQLLAVINRDWASDGQVVRASTRHQAAGDGDSLPASATLLVSSLLHERPLILSTQGHAVVVVGVTYAQRGPWMRITGGTVIDPRPGVGRRSLAAGELAVALLASVEVSPRPAGQLASVAARARDAAPR